MRLFKILLLLSFGFIGSACVQKSAPAIDESVKEVCDAAADSMYTNRLYAKNILRNKMNGVDSVHYYFLLLEYNKVCFTGGEFDSARINNHRILNYLQSVSDTTALHYTLLSGVCNFQGNIEGISNHYDAALAHYEEAYRYAQKGTNPSSLVDIGINLADMNIQSGRMAEAAAHYRKALFVCDSLNLSPLSRFPIYYGLGQAYTDLRNFEQADHFYEKAEDFFEYMNPVEKFVYLNNRGNSYYFRKDYTTALHYMRRAYQLTEGRDEMIWQSNLCRVNLGELYLLTGKTDSAQWALSSCRPFFVETQNDAALYYIDTQMIELAVVQGKLGEAARLIAQTETSSSENVAPNLLQIRQKYLQHFFEEKGDYKQAYRYLKEGVDLTDSIHNKEVLMRVSEMAMRYRQDTVVLRKELLIQRQASQMEALHTSSMFLAVTCVLLVLMLVFLVYFVRKRRALLHEQHVNQVIRLRMEKIRSNVSPHFTFNVLNRQLASLKGHDPEAYNSLFDLVTLLRRSLELTGKLHVTLKEELDFIQNYLRLESKRVGEDFLFNLEVDPDVRLDEINIPSVLVQTAVENALKHGLVGLDREKRLDIRIRKEGSGVRIHVIDNGRGFNASAVSATRGTGIGFKVLYQTLLMLNKKNKNEQIEFNITPVPSDIYPSGTFVNIYIPLNYSYEL